MGCTGCGRLISVAGEPLTGSADGTAGFDRHVLFRHGAGRADSAAFFVPVEEYAQRLDSTHGVDRLPLRALFPLLFCVHCSVFLSLSQSKRPV